MNFRNATMNDLDCICEIEQKCFPVSEMASRKNLEWRIEHAYFLLLCQDETIVSFINGMPTNKSDLCDEMYDGEFFDENGQWLMIFGVDTPKEYQHQGYAQKVMKEVMHQFNGKGIVLTCKEHLIGFYEQFGYKNEGISKSTHGDVTWYQMRWEKS